jgi:hypothetical protein
MDVAPLIYEASKCKKCTVRQALAGSAWVRNITLETPLSPDFISQFVELWRLARDFQLLEDEVEDITWNLMGNGQYSASSAYEVQFFGLVYSDLYALVWRAWATPKRSIMRGLFFKIVFGRTISYNGGVGQIVGFAHFASKLQNLRTTSLCFAASPSAFGSFSRSGLAFMGFFRGNGVP